MPETPTFDAVFASCREKVFSLALHVTGNRHDAEDATQETFLSVHRALAQFRGEASIQTWVLRIALRASISVKARKREVSLPENIEPASEPPDRALVAREQARRLATAMALLSGEQRAVVSLFAVDGLSHREIAEVLGVPEGTVWSRLHTARKRLATALEHSEVQTPRETGAGRE